MLLHLQTVPTRNGLLWIRHGLKVYQRKPWAMTGLFCVFLFAAAVVLNVPVVGVLLLLMSLPLLCLGFMLATHQVLQDQTPTLAVYLAPLKLTPERRNRQLLLGALYALATLAISLLAAWIDGGSFEAFERLVSSGATADQIAAAASAPQLFWGTLSRIALAALVSVPFWHAPALIHWGGQGVMQALFSSTLGIWRNRAAFAWNAMLWGALFCGVALVGGTLLSLLGLAGLLPLLAVPLVLLMSTVFYASLYFTFVDCFMSSTPAELFSSKAP